MSTRPRRSIIQDKVNPIDFRQLSIMYACEDCSFYKAENKECLMGWPSEPHQRDAQLKTFHLTGRMSICRLLEID